LFANVTVPEAVLAGGEAERLGLRGGHVIGVRTGDRIGGRQTGDGDPVDAGGRILRQGGLYLRVAVGVESVGAAAQSVVTERRELDGDVDRDRVGESVLEKLRHGGDRGLECRGRAADALAVSEVKDHCSALCFAARPSPYYHETLWRADAIPVIDLLEATPGIEPGYTVLQTVA
jgi:hypothetical protein